MRCIAILLSVGWLAAGCSSNSDSDHVDDMAREHADDNPQSNPMSQDSPAMEVTTEVVDYATVDGVTATGYLARPAGVDGPLPGSSLSMNGGV